MSGRKSALEVDEVFRIKLKKKNGSGFASLEQTSLRWDQSYDYEIDNWCSRTVMLNVYYLNSW